MFYFDIHIDIFMIFFFMVPLLKTTTVVLPLLIYDHHLQQKLA